MKITKQQLRRIVIEEKAKFLSEAVTRPGAEIEELVHLRDVDSDRPMTTRISAKDGMVTLEFSNSFILHLDTLDAQSLGQALANVAVEHGQQRAFKAMDEPGYE